MVDEGERDYLLAEFSESFQHMGKLDDRRFEILRFYASFIAAVLAASVALLSIDALRSEYRAGGVIVLLLISSLVSWAAGRVLISERKAAERYRNKLNAIRKTLLHTDSSSELKEFFNLGGAVSIGTAQIQSKGLNFLDIFRTELHCTALYIKVLIDVGLFISLAAAALIGIVTFL